MIAAIKEARVLSERFDDFRQQAHIALPTMRANLEFPGWLTSRGAFARLLRERRQRSAPINRVSRFDEHHKQRPYSFGRIDTRITKRRQRHDSCCRRIVVQVGGFGEEYSEATRWFIRRSRFHPAGWPAIAICQTSQ